MKYINTVSYENVQPFLIAFFAFFTFVGGRRMFAEFNECCGFIFDELVIKWIIIFGVFFLPSRNILVAFIATSIIILLFNKIFLPQYLQFYTPFSRKIEEEIKEHKFINYF
jgi:hypothetical protein